MDLTIIILAGGTMLVLASVAGYLLGLANKVFHVEVDPRIEKINEALPGANCGGCGYVGCMPYAEAVVGGDRPDKCTVGGAATAEDVAEIMGIKIEVSAPLKAIVHCGAHYEDRLGRSEYRGEQTCAAAHLVSGVQACTYGCLGLGDCVAACEFDAIHIIDGLAVVDEEKCVGCGACAKACPRLIISMERFKNAEMYNVACSNKDFGKDVKAVCKVGCIGCSLCAKSSPLFLMEDKLAVVDYDHYDADKVETAPVAKDKCPTKCIITVGGTPDAP